MRDPGSHDGHGAHYRRLLAMVVLHFAAMYLLMYVMVDALQNVYHNFNQVYMAGLMTASMVLIEIPLMRSMYPNGKLNAIILGAGAAALLGCYFFVRQQTAISDRQFLRSMIPHHAAAILMCEEAPIRDPEITRLCAEIVAGQQAEINLMKEILARPGE
jgi:hypothetical protein